MSEVEKEAMELVVPIVKQPKRKSEEGQLYGPVMSALKEKFEKFVGYEGTVHLEITADGHFSEELKEALDDRALAILRVEKLSPDIAGFLQKKDSTYKELVTIEVKPNNIKLKHIYRAKLYADIFDAKYGLLISPKKIREEIKRFIQSRSAILYRPARSLIIAQFDKTNNEFKFDEKLYSTIPEPFKS